MLFVLSAGRSGSRTISNVLSQSDDIVCTHEPRPRLVEESVRYRYGDLSANKLEKMLQESRPESILGRRYGEAANRLALVTPVLAAVFPEAQFIWLVRDGRDFVSSGVARGWYADARDNPWEPWEQFRLRGDRLGEVDPDEWENWSSFRRVCWLWRRTNEIIRDDLAALEGGADRSRFVRLEELHDEIDGIADFLGITPAAWSIGRLNERPAEAPTGDDETDPRPARIGWEDWSDEDAADFALECGPLMDELYPQWRNPASMNVSPDSEPVLSGDSHDPVEVERAELVVLRAEMKLFVNYAKRTDRANRKVLEKRDALADELAVVSSALASAEAAARAAKTSGHDLEKLQARLGDTEKRLEAVLASESYRIGNRLVANFSLPLRLARRLRRRLRPLGASAVKKGAGPLYAHPAARRMAKMLPDRVVARAVRLMSNAGSRTTTTAPSNAVVHIPRFGLRAVVDHSVTDARWTDPLDTIAIGAKPGSVTHVDLLVTDLVPSPALEKLATTWSDAVTVRTRELMAPLPAGLTPRGIGDDHDGTILALATSSRPAPISSPLPGRAVVVRRAAELPDPVTAPLEFVQAMQHHLFLLDDGRLHDDPHVRAELLLAASACGLPVVVTDDEGLRSLVASEVLSAWTNVDARLLTRKLERERLSWEQRRLVHRFHSPRAVFDGLLVTVGRPGLPTPSMSVLVASNRPALVDHWSPLIAAQDHPEFEVVWAQHGPGFSDREAVVAREHLGDRLTIVRVPEQHGLGDALNAATDAASGRVVVKWDDDDLYHPGHLTDLAIARDFSGATLVGKAAEFVYLEGLDVTVRRFANSTESFSATIGGPTLSIARGDLADLGGWRRTRRRVDALLIEDVQAAGGTTYRTAGFGFVMMRAARSGHSHTWGADSAYFLANSTEQRKGLDLEFAGFAPAGGSGARSTDVVRRNEWHFVHGSDETALASVSVIIPARDCQAALDRLLSSLTAQDYPSESLEIIVVDDASSPPLVVPDGVVRVELEPTDRFGAGRARNAGALRATGEFLVFLDADVLVGCDVIGRLSSWYRRHPAAVVTGILGFFDLEAVGADAVAAAIADRRLPDLLAGRTDNDQHWRDRHFERSHDLTDDGPDLFRQMIGAIMGVPASMHRSVGGLRELGIRGIEDTEYGYRLHNAGALFVLDRELDLFHQGRRFFDSAKADQAKQQREALNLELMPVPSVRAASSVPRQVPVATVTVADGVVLDGWDERLRRDVDLLDGGERPAGVDPGDLAASPYAVQFTASCRIEPDAFDRLLDHARTRGLGVVHLLAADGTEIGVLTSRRAVGRAAACGFDGPATIAHAVAAFGEWWLPANLVGIHA